MHTQLMSVTVKEATLATLMSSELNALSLCLSSAIYYLCDLGQITQPFCVLLYYSVIWG